PRAHGGRAEQPGDRGAGVGQREHRQEPFEPGLRQAGGAAADAGGATREGVADYSVRLGRKDGRTEGRKDGKTERRKDGRSEGRKVGRGVGVLGESEGNWGKSYIWVMRGGGCGGRIVPPLPIRSDPCAGSC